MAVERTYYTIDPEGKLTCMKCKVPLVKGKAKFMYLENGFPVEMPVCPKCGFVYVPEELAVWISVSASVHFLSAEIRKRQSLNAGVY